MHAAAIDEDLLRLLDVYYSFWALIKDDLDTTNKNVLLSTNLTVDPSPAFSTEVGGAFDRQPSSTISATTPEAPCFVFDCATPSSTTSLVTPTREDLFGGLPFPLCVQSTPYTFSQDSLNPIPVSHPSSYLHLPPNIQPWRPTLYSNSYVDQLPLPVETTVPPPLNDPTYDPFSDPSWPSFGQQASGWNHRDVFDLRGVGNGFMDPKSGYHPEPQRELKGPNRVKRTLRQSAPYKDHEGALLKLWKSQQESLSEIPGYETFGHDHAPKCATRRNEKKSPSYPLPSPPSNSRKEALRVIRRQARSKNREIAFVYVDGNEWA